MAHHEHIKEKVLKRYPHDPEAFTEGLCFANGFLYESTGLNGKSSVRKVDLRTGRILKAKVLPSKYIGEGLTEVARSAPLGVWREAPGASNNAVHCASARTRHQAYSCVLGVFTQLGVLVSGGTPPALTGCGFAGWCRHHRCVKISSERHHRCVIFRRASP